MGIESQVISPWLRFIKSVAEGAVKLIHRSSVRIDRHLAIFHLAEPSHIVESHYMIGMRMSKESGIETPHPFPDTLDSEFRSRIDDKVSFRRLDQYRGTSASVPRVIRFTDRTVTPDDGDSLGCSGSEKGEFQ